MSVHVSFSPPITPAKLSRIQSSIEALSRGEPDRWEVQIGVGGSDDRWTLTINGPQYHRRVYDVFGENRLEAPYLSALVRTEIRAFPGTVPPDVAFALAELAILGVPYDDSSLFDGHVEVNGWELDTTRLAELYRREQLRSVLFS